MSQEAQKIGQELYAAASASDKSTADKQAAQEGDKKNKGEKEPEVKEGEVVDENPEEKK